MTRFRATDSSIQVDCIRVGGSLETWAITLFGIPEPGGKLPRQLLAILSVMALLLLTPHQQTLGVW